MASMPNTSRLLPTSVLLMLLFGVLMAAPGCLPVFEHRVTPQHARIDGIAGSLERSNKVGILFVPGMGGFSGEGANQDPAPLLRYMAKELGLSAPESSTRVTDETEQALYRKWDFVDEKGAQRVTAYAIPWNFITFGVRSELRESDKLPGRVLINREVKSGLVNSNLSDVVLYLGEYGEPVRQFVRGSLLHMASSLGEHDEVIVVGYSLGSQVLADVVEEVMAEGGDGAGRLQEPLSKINEFFMVSNQLPLLALHRTDPYHMSKTGFTRGPASDPMRSLRVFVDIRQERKALEMPDEDPLKIVAITDPNDLLSYAAPDGSLSGAEIININTVVADWSLLGLLVNPWDAHTGYGKDRRVLRLMTHGINHD